MAAHFDMTETPEGFTIHIERPRSWLETLFNAAIGIFAYFFIRSLIHPATSVAIFVSVVIAALMGYFRGRPRSITTTINKLEAHIVGTFAGGYKPPQYVPLADIFYLEYREAVNGGGESADLPEGLWAVLNNGNACLVPYIDQLQTEPLVTSIHQRFDHILGSSPSRNTGLSATGLIQLNLTKR